MPGIQSQSALQGRFSLKNDQIHPLPLGPGADCRTQLVYSARLAQSATIDIKEIIVREFSTGNNSD